MQEEKPKMRRKVQWNGTYRDVVFEIQNFSFDQQVMDKWAAYIYVRLDGIPAEFDPESFWLVPKESGLSKRKSPDYYSHPIISAIEFHHGITYYSKELRDDESRLIKLGCDYQHYWDEGKDYDEIEIRSDICRSIDSLFEIMPGYIAQEKREPMIDPVKAQELIDQVKEATAALKKE